MSMKIDIRDGISDELALDLVSLVVREGKVSQDSKGKKYYCWVTIFNIKGEEIAVYTRENRKNDCFVVYKYNKQTK